MEGAEEKKPNYDNLPLEERLTHSSYDARKSGVEQLIQNFTNEDDTQSSTFAKYQGKSHSPVLHLDNLIKLIGDKNVLVIEKTLEALKLFVEKYKNATKIAKEVIPIIIDKCLGSPKLKKLSTEVLLLFVEIDTPDIVISELIKGFSHKIPKTIQFCVEIVREVYKNFGIPTCSVKECIPQLIKLFDNKAGPVRQEANLLCGELYRWIRGALKNHFNDLRSAQLKELETIFAKIDEEEKPTPIKRLRSYVPKLEKMTSSSEDQVEEEESCVEIEMPSFDVLSQIKSDWYDKLSSGVDHTYKGPEDQKPKPIKVRTDCLAELNKKLATSERYSVGDYHGLITGILKMVGEPQALVSHAAIESLQYLVKGLKGLYSPYVGQTILPMMTKFKEKRQATTNHIHVILEEIDAHCKPFTEFWSDVETCIKIKVPQTKENILIFLEKAISKKKANQLTKVFKPLLSICSELMIDADGTVRDAALKCFSRLMSLFERECISVYDKMESSKQKKIQEVIATFRSAPITTKKENTMVIKQVAPVVQEAGKKRVAVEMNESTSPIKNVPKKTKMVHAPKTSPRGKKREETFSTLPLVAQESVEARFDDLIPETIRTLLNEKKWEERKRGFDDLANHLTSCDDITCEIVIKRLSINPGWKESNMNILVKMMETIKKVLSVTSKPGGQSVVLVIEFILKQIGTLKLTSICKECLTIMSESTSPLFVFTQVMKQLGDVKAPNNVGEVISWVGDAITDFGVFGLNPLVDGLKVYIDNINTKIKKSCIQTLCTLKKYAGESLIDSFADIKPALLTVLKEEFGKVTCDINYVAPKRKQEEKMEEVKEVKMEVKKVEKQTSVVTKETKPAATVSKPVVVKEVIVEKVIEPTLTYTNQKVKREQSSIVWNMDQEYRQDLFDLLSNEMKGNMSSEIVSHLMTNNEVAQISAIKAICESMSDKRALFDNLDLIMKWSALSLAQCGYKLSICITDLLQATIALCKQEQYQFTTFEANILIPCLVESLGSKFVSIRGIASDLLEKCQDLYLITKFTWFLEKGLKSSNNYIKMTCLQHLGNLIKKNGITICHLEIFSTILSCIDDNEAIRTAALPVASNILVLFEGDVNLLFANLSSKKLIQERLHTWKSTLVKSEPSITVQQLDIALDENSIIRELRNIDTQQMNPETLEKTIQVFKTLGSIIESKEIGEIIIHLKEIVTRLSIHMDESFSAFEPNFRLCKYVLNCLLLVFENTQIVELISTEEMERLLDFIILIMMDQNVSKISNGMELLKGVNTLLLKMIHNGSRTCIFSALIHLLSKATQQEKSNKYFEMVIQCLLRISKDIPKTYAKIDFDILMREIHEYLQAFPTVYFKGKSDLPLRTIRSVLNEVVNFKGPSIRTHLSLIPTHKNPSIVNYMELMLKSVEIKVLTREIKTPSVTIPQDAEKELKEIFEVIANPNFTSSGIYKLYKYNNEHPDVDWSASFNGPSQMLEMIVKQLDLMKKHEQVIQNPTDLKPIGSVSASPSINARREERRMSKVTSSTTVQAPRQTTQDLTTIRSRLMALNEEKENQI